MSNNNFLPQNGLYENLLAYKTEVFEKKMTRGRLAYRAQQQHNTPLSTTANSQKETELAKREKAIFLKEKQLRKREAILKRREEEITIREDEIRRLIRAR